MTATLNVVVSINSTTVMQTNWTAPSFYTFALKACASSAFSLGVGTNPERICPIYTFALKACATARLSRSLFFFMSSVQFVVDVLPVYAFFIHKNANKIQQIRCFPDNFVLSVGFADFFSFFFNLFANTLSV